MGIFLHFIAPGKYQFLQPNYISHIWNLLWDILSKQSLLLVCYLIFDFEIKFLLKRYLKHVAQNLPQEKKTAKENLFSNWDSQGKSCVLTFSWLLQTILLSVWINAFFLVPHIVVLGSIYEEYSILSSLLVENVFHQQHCCWHFCSLWLLVLWQVVCS